MHHIQILFVSTFQSSTQPPRRASDFVPVPYWTDPWLFPPATGDENWGPYMESPDSPPYILITAAGAWILITLISGRCAQLSVQCSGLLTDTQSIRSRR